MINNVISAAKSGEVDPVWYNLLKEVNSDYPIVPVTKIENYVFNDELLKLDKWVLVCILEYGWNHPFEKQVLIFGALIHLLITLDLREKNGESLIIS